jgi:hypothetical protein
LSDRLFTLVGAGLALILLTWLLGGGAQPAAPEHSRPISQDAGAAGLLGLYRWLEASHIPVLRLRKRYTELAAVAPGTGHLLVVAEPMVWAVRPTEAQALRDWVLAGNHVLLLSSQAMQRRWDLRGGAAEALGLRRTYLPLVREDGDETPLPAAVRERRDDCAGEAMSRGAIGGPQRRLRPATNAGHPVTRGLGEVHVKVPPPNERSYRALEHEMRPRHDWALLCDPQLRLPVFSAMRIGDGRIWALDYGEALGNDNLGRGDNARLFANLAAFTLGARGQVIFDDMHQGDSELYDPAAFYGDSRLHGTLAFLGGIWLLWLLGYSSRFAPPAAPAPRQGGRAFVLAAGRFQARYLRPSEAALGLFRHFFNAVRQRYRLPTTGEPAWDALARGPGRADAELAQLRDWHAQALRGRPVDLARLRNLILKVQDSST